MKIKVNGVSERTQYLMFGLVLQKIDINTPYTCHTPLESYDSQLSELV